MTSSEAPPDEFKSAVTDAVQSLRVALVFSFALNLLVLTAPLYMLHVFDSVLSSRSVDTLLLLTLIAIVALLALALIDAIRGRLLIRTGAWFEGRLSGEVLKAEIDLAALGAGEAAGDGLGRLATIRNFLGGPGIGPLLDAPWVPFFLLVIFLLHPLLGWVSVAGAIGLFALAWLNDRLTREGLEGANRDARISRARSEAAIRNADAVQAMGMAEAIIRLWRERDSLVSLARLRAASEKSGLIAAASKFLRLAVQVGVIGTGAWLFIAGELTPGGMIAGSVLMSRALAPVEQSIGGWRQFVAARSAFRRLRELLSARPADRAATRLPRPSGKLSIEGLGYLYSGRGQPALRGINLRLAPGEALGVIGPTAAGKSTLARLVVGSLRPAAGHVRLDGMDVHKWAADDRGQYVGYVPQDVELFPGTVRENIARLKESDDEAVFKAAKLAGAHDMILHLEKGYDTMLDASGGGLSGGQMQRIALARAVFGDPALVVLDEPNANLDNEGDTALVKAIEAVKAAGTTVVVIAHRPALLRGVDKILVLRQGRVAQIGTRDEILERFAGPTAVPAKKEKKA